MRSDLLAVLAIVLAVGRAHADDLPPPPPPPPAPDVAPAPAGPAVEVPFDAPPDQSILEGKCAKWSTGLVGTVCSFCMDANDSSCRMCRNGFDSSTCSVAARGVPPTFGSCEARGDDQVCVYKEPLRSMRCRYSATHSACYYPPANNDNRADADWIESRPPPLPGAPHCISQDPPRPGQACVTPAPDGVHGKLCFSSDPANPLRCVDVASPLSPPTFGDCSGTAIDQVCDFSGVRCRYWGGPLPNMQCYAESDPPADTIWIDNGHMHLGAHTSRGGSDGGGRSYRLPNKLYVGIELGAARPGATDFFENGYGRSFVFGALGFEVRVLEEYDLPDPKKMFTNVAGTSSAFVLSSFAYRYQLASSSPVSFSVLGGIAVMHRSLFGVSGDQIPGFEDFPDVQQQFGVGAMLGGGVVLWGLAYVDVRAYPTMWGGVGTGDNAASPGGTPITGNAGVRVGF